MELKLIQDRGHEFGRRITFGHKIVKKRSECEGILRINIIYIVGDFTNIFHLRFMYGSFTVHLWFMYGSCTVHVWFMYGSCTVHLWFMYGSCTVHVRFIHGPCTVHVRFIHGSFTIRLRFIYGRGPEDPSLTSVG